MPKLSILCIHCTATPEGRAVTPETIRQWHTDPLALAGGQFQYMGKTYASLDKLPKEVRPTNRRGRGWKQVGYSDMILLGGSLVNLVRYNDDDVVDAWEITNGASGINSKTRHIVYVGGTDSKLKTKDTRTADQLETLKQYVISMIKKYPSIKVAGHNQFAKKDCPSFNVPTWLRSIGVADKNIYAQ